MAEYIEREALLKFIENGINNPDRKEAFGYDAVEILEKVQYMPAADVAPVRHGRWIDAREYCGDYMCSNCDALYGTNKFNYCPSCGAKMDLEDSECDTLRRSWPCATGCTIGFGEGFLDSVVKRMGKASMWNL